MAIVFNPNSNTPAIVEVTSGLTTSQSITITGVTAGNTLFVAVSCCDTGANTITLSFGSDTSGQTWTKEVSAVNTTTADVSVALFRLFNANAGSHTVSISQSGAVSSSFWELSCWEVTPLALDKSPAGVTSTTSPLVGPSTGTLSNATEFAAAVCGDNASTSFVPALPTGFTLIKSGNGSGSGVGFSSVYQITSATTALNPSWTTGSGAGNGAVIATYTDASGPKVGKLSKRTGPKGYAGSQEFGLRLQRGQLPPAAVTPTPFFVYGVPAGQSIIAEDYRPYRDFTWKFVQNGLKVATQVEKGSGIQAEEFRRVSESVWNDFRPFWTHPVTQASFTIYNPVPAGQSIVAEDYRPYREAIFHFVQNGMNLPLMVEKGSQIQAEEYRRVSEDVWSAFRPFWTTPAQPQASFTIYNPVPSGQRVEAESYDVHRILTWTFTQTGLATWRQPEKGSGIQAEEFRRVGDEPPRVFFKQFGLRVNQSIVPAGQPVQAEEYRRVSEDVWGAFRPFWKHPASGIPFFVYQVPAGQRIEAEQFDTHREAIFHYPQTRLAAWIQPEDHHWTGAEEYRSVGDNGWDQFMYFKSKTVYGTGRGNVVKGGIWN